MLYQLSYTPKACVALLSQQGGEIKGDCTTAAKSENAPRCRARFPVFSGRKALLSPVP